MAGALGSLVSLVSLPCWYQFWTPALPLCGSDTILSRLTEYTPGEQFSRRCL